MSTHIQIVAWLNIALSVLGLVGAAFIFAVMAGAGLLSGDPEAVFVTSAIGFGIGTFFFAVSVPGLIGGVGLLRRAEWARILMLIVAAFQLMNIPFGTLLGIYTFWALLQDDTKRLFVQPA